MRNPLNDPGTVLSPEADTCGANNEGVIREFEQASDSLWRENRPLALATLLGPVIAGGLVLATCAVVGGLTLVRRVVITALLTFFVFGRFVILAGRTQATDAAVGFTPEQLAALVLFMDVATAIVISWHVGVLFRLPWLGRRLGLLMDHGNDVLAENPWMRRTTFLAIVAFVMFPLASSGSVGGSLLGRLLGLSRRSTLFGVTLGSVAGCGLMYYGATVINRYLDADSPWLTWGGLAVVAVFVALLNRRYRRRDR